MRLVIPHELAHVRLDAALARLLPEHSRSRLAAWLEAGRIRVDGAHWPGKRRVAGGETIELDVPEPVEAGRDEPEARPLSILFEDEELLVLDKPPGLVVHPGAGHPRGTLLNALLHHAPQLSALPRAGIVHRLDRDTSGIMMVAKTLEAHTALVRELQARKVRREYLALVHGLIERAGRIEGAIGRDPHRRTRMAVVEPARGKPAITHYRPREVFAAADTRPTLTLIECRLETGRTHQIRVHLAHLGHPLVGDPVYGRRRDRLLGRQALHAWRLSLCHPRSGEPLRLSAPLAPDFAALVRALRAGQQWPGTAPRRGQRLHDEAPRIDDAPA
ncbi:MAG: RluA family pseudouridine synthase [Casimicrobiaceae bacterium]|nr:RluA family pseudouridine synthase [Casimicrobiaceae bacterium]